jgi:hypothetical protein
LTSYGWIDFNKNSLAGLKFWGRELVWCSLVFGGSNTAVLEIGRLHIRQLRASENHRYKIMTLTDG